MKFFDVLFPVNLGPLTYRCDDVLSHYIKPGMIVSAPLKNRTSIGVVIAASQGVPHIKVKDIQKVISDVPVLSDKLINLLRWMAEYYVTEQGLVLKNMLPKETFVKVRKRKRKGPSYPTYENYKGGDYGHSDLHIDNIKQYIKNSVIERKFETFLLHAPSSKYEISLLREVLTEIDNAIILVPEISLLHNLYQLLKDRFGKGACLFHSGLSKGKRSEAIERIISGDAHIIIGTRSAVFAPMKKVSIIVVLHEHNSSYKQENSPCYHGRDVAVKRGYFEEATVLLSSVCPSLESLYNCRRGKYTLLKPKIDVKRPKMRIVDMRYEKLLKPYLAKSVINAALRHINKEQKVMFVLNRRGYSTVFQCLDCGHREECPHCKLPLVFHKQDMSLKCHYCGYALSHIPESCGVCKGFNIQLLGAGTQRLKEDIEELVGIKTLRLDSDKLRKKSEREGLGEIILKGNYSIIVGTKLMARRMSFSGKFSMAVMINTDQFLNIPDFRSAEKAFQEILIISDRIESNGEVILQTRMPQNYLYRYLKNYSYGSFSKEEMHQRKSLSYPPYSRLLMLRFTSKRDLSKEVLDVLKKIDRDIEALGPSFSKDRGRHEVKILFRSTHQEKLHSAAGIFIQSFKNKRDVRIRVDVDPVNI